MAPRVTRREFLALTSKLSLLSVATLQGCEYVVADVLIPAIAGLTLTELYGFAKEHFGRTFRNGETLGANNGDLTIYQNGLSDNLTRQFKTTIAENLYCTPVSVLRHGIDYFLQLGEEAAGWSLVTGGKNNETVFHIHKNWIDWLLTKDNCNLRFAANSVFEPCGVEGCPIYVTKQSFIQVDGKVTKLDIKIDEEKYDRETLRIHKERHVTEWKGCPVVPGEVEQCVA